MKNISEYQPFAEPLENKKSEHVYEFSDENDIEKKLNPNGDKIVRRLADELPHDKDIGDEGIDKLIDIIKENEDRFEELKNKYGIDTPKQESLIATSEKGLYQDGRVIYTVVNKIDGENLSDVDLKEEEFEEWGVRFDELYSSLIQYLTDKHLSGERYLRDIFTNKQYMYGVEAGEDSEKDKKKIHLIDIEPRLSKIPKNEYEKCDEELACLVYVVNSIILLESKIGEVKLKNVKEKINNFFNILDLENNNDFSRLKGDVEIIKRLLEMS
jgi:hypothetical protein